MVYLDLLKTSFIQKQPLFYSLTGTSICKQRTVAMVLLALVMQIFANGETNKLD